MKPVKMNVYTYVDNKTGCKTVKAVTNCAGQTLFAIAKCDPSDEFNQEFGEKLAALRLNMKVAKLRAAIARERIADAYEYFSWLDKEEGRVAGAIKREVACVSDRLTELDELKKAEEALLATV